MSDSDSTLCTAFDGYRLLASGPVTVVALAVKAAIADRPTGSILVFDDLSGRIIDLDLRGSDAEIAERLTLAMPGKGLPSQPVYVEVRQKAVQEEVSGPRGRGRPKLGVVAREITLLPRQWEWLAAQPGGASAVIRKLVDEARRSGATRLRKRAMQDAAYQFMHAIAGDLPGFEDATRALYADDRGSLERRIADWPADVKLHALRLAFGPAGDQPT